MSRLTATAAALVVALYCLSAAEAIGPLFGSKNLNSHAFSKYVPPPPTGNQPLDFLDKLYEKLDDIKREMKTAAEYLDALEAQLTLLVKLTDEINRIIIVQINVTNENQNATIYELKEHLADLNDTLNDLDDDLTILSADNSANVATVASLYLSFSTSISTNINQDGEIAALQSKVEGLKPKLLQVFGNEFALSGGQTSALATQLQNLRQLEATRMCETGVVTMDANNPRVEYLYQSKYSCIPQLFYQASGYSVLLNDRPTPPPSYGTYLPWREPNAMGFFVSAIPGRYGATFQLSDQAFGDSKLQRVTVSFQACTVSTGTGSVHD